VIPAAAAPSRRLPGVKALRMILRMRKQDPNERQEQETIVETYMQALGMI
jgi:uncharacterized protein (UPF0335 family)